MKKYYSFIILSVFTIVSCSIKPDPINYGSDGCHFCSMTIVDKQHAAEIVTDKGKSFKFDASECMMNHIKSIDQTTISMFLVNDFNQPGTLIDATEATFLISKNIPSPMGAYLSAFKSKEAAETIQSLNEGELYTWEALSFKFKKDR